MQHWDTLSRTGKLLLGSVPAITTFALAMAMWRVERFRLFFVALIVAVLATPLLMGVWLYEFKIGATVPAASVALEAFHNSADSTAITNQQILITALVTLLVAAAVMVFTRTTTHSAQTLAAFALFYAACLLWYGLRPHVDHKEWASLALKCLPLLLAVSAVGLALLKREDRYFQAPPWLYFAAVLLLVIGYALSLNALEEWTSLNAKIREPLSLLLLTVVGAIQTVIGLIARALLRHRCRPATLIVIFVGLLNVLIGLGLAGWEHTWPDRWPTLSLFGQAVPSPHVALPLAALLITLLACRYQMFAFLMVGLAGVAFSVHVLGHLYFAQVPAWPKALMALGAICFFAALYRELRRTRGNTIDDVVGQSRL
jgi:hypothetical protein